MIPAAFEYHAPSTIGEATALLARLGEDAKVLSGGQSLIPLMKLRLANPAHLVDINGIPGLSGIREADGFLRIGALTRESELEESQVVRSRYPLLHDTSMVIADPLVRNLATVGGNLAHGDPANDHPATMLALGVPGGRVVGESSCTSTITAWLSQTHNELPGLLPPPAPARRGVGPHGGRDGMRAPHGTVGGAVTRNDGDDVGKRR